MPKLKRMKTRRTPTDAELAGMGPISTKRAEHPMSLGHMEDGADEYKARKLAAEKAAAKGDLSLRQKLEEEREAERERASSAEPDDES